MHQQNYSFVVRVWLESANSNITEHPIWRGSIQQVGRGSRTFFSDLKEIARFIEEQIRVETDPGSSDFQQLLKTPQEKFKNLWIRLIHKLFRR